MNSATCGAMSAAINEGSGVTSISYRFVLKWTLKANQLRDPSITSARSDLYVFKTAKDLQFYLEVIDDYDTPCIHIKGSKKWSLKIDYAFCVIKERAYKMTESTQLSFLTIFDYSDLTDEENITIHSVVMARPNNPALYAEKDESTTKENQNVVNFEDVPDIPFPTNYTNAIVINFILNGDVPKLTTENAIKIISEAKQHKCEEIKVLCMEYLLNNITQQSIKQISKAAIDYNLSHLERKCLEKIAFGYFQIK